MAAGVAFAPRGARFEQSCLQCTKDPEKRRLWGCDAPTQEPVLEITCPACANEHDECEHCGGTGQIPIHRCPNVIATRTHLDVCRAVVQVEHGILPDSGGWQDQAAVFTEAWPIVINELAFWRGVAQRQAEAQARANPKR